MTTEKTDGRLLSAKYKISDLALCTVCKVFLRFPKKHLKTTHGLSEDQIKRESQLCDLEMKSKTFSAEDKYVRSVFEGLFNEGPKHDMGNKLYPQIEGLSTTDGYQCLKCWQLFKDIKKVVAHVKSCKHNNHINVQDRYRPVVMQALFGGNQMKYFPVQSIHVPVQIEWFQSELRKRESFGNSYDADCCGPSGKSALLATLGFDTYISSIGLTIEQAHGMVGDQCNKYRYNLHKVLTKYVEHSVKLFDDNAHCRFQTLRGHKIKLNVKTQTISNYVRHFLPLFPFLGELPRNKQCSIQLNAPDVDIISVFHSRSWAVEDTDEDSQNFQRLLYSIFLRNNPTDYIPLFIACSSVKEGSSLDGRYRFAVSTELSPLLAALQFFANCVVVEQVHGYGSALTLSNEWTFGQPRSSEPHERWAAINLHHASGRVNGYTYVRNCLDATMMIMKTDIPTIRFIQCSKHKNCGLIDGHELSIKTLGSTIRRVIHDCQELLFGGLLGGFFSNCKETFDDVLSSLHDDFTNRDYGSSFMTHPRNSETIKNWQKDFIGYTAPSLLDGAQSKPRTQDINKFLNGCDIFLEKMFWLLAVTGGGPPRLSELVTLQVENGASSFRHIFVSQGRAFYALFYHKGRDKLEGVGKPIARYPCLHTSELLLYYIIFVKPVRWVLERKMGRHAVAIRKAEPSEDEIEDDMARDLQLFTDRGLGWNQRKYRLAFAKIMHETGAKINARDYRQYHAGVVKSFNISSGDVLRDTNSECSTETIHKQTGHSVTVANELYGVSEGDMKSLDSIQLDRFRKASFSWHMFLEISNYTNRQHEVNNGNKGSEEIQKMNSPGKSNLAPCCSENIKAIVEPMLLGYLNPIMEVLKEVKENQRRILDRDGEKPKIDLQPNQLPAAFSIGSIKRALQSLTGNDQATFRSTEQKNALALSCNLQSDLLVVLPTGCGKSMLYLLPLTLQTTKCIVLIIPLVSLQQDTLKKCKQLGICTVSWEDRNMAGARLILASIEHVAKPSYQSFILEKFKTDGLYAIFVDEVHLVKQWEGFRPAMAILHKHIRPESVSVPLVGLTATCPPKMEKLVMAQIGMSDPQIVRQPNQKANISYCVQSVEPTELSKEITVLNAYMECKKKLGAISNNFFRGIVYCKTRAFVDSLYSAVLTNAVHMCVSKYHAGMSGESRKNNFSRWITPEGKKTSTLMIATSAFGCGIDIPDVRIVLHVDMPDTIMEYLQESGRAGRDGLQAKSVILNFAGEDSLSGCVSVEASSHSVTNPGDSDDVTEPHGIEDLRFSEVWNPEPSEHALFGSLSPWLSTSNEDCRRWALEEYNEGKSTREFCFDRNLVPCDNCLKRKQVIAREYTSENNAFLNINNITGRLNRKDIKVERVLDSSEISPRSNSFASPVLTKRLHFDSQNNTPTSSTPSVKRRSISGGQTTMQQFFKKEQIPREETVKQECDNPQNMDLQYSTDGARPSSLGKVDTGKMLAILTRLDGMCPVCSVLQKKLIKHEETRNGGGSGTESMACFHGRCFKCGSRNCYDGSCPLKLYRKNGDSPHRNSTDKQRNVPHCYRCTFANHDGGKLHLEGQFGKNNCVLGKCVTMINIMQQEGNTPEFNRLFPPLIGCGNVMDLIQQLKQQVTRDYLYIADVVAWIFFVYLKESLP